MSQHSPPTPSGWPSPESLARGGSSPSIQSTAVPPRRPSARPTTTPCGSEPPQASRLVRPHFARRPARVHRCPIRADLNRLPAALVTRCRSVARAASAACRENDNGNTVDAPARGASAPRVTASANEPERRPLTVGHAKQRSALRNATGPSRGARCRRQRHVVLPVRQWLAADRLRAGGQ